MCNRLLALTHFVSYVNSIDIATVELQYMQLLQLVFGTDNLPFKRLPKDSVDWGARLRGVRGSNDTC